MSATMITVELDTELNRELLRVAHDTGLSVEDLVRDAIVEWLEDRQDIRDAEQILQPNEPSRPIAEMREPFGLEL